jgi:hypothetical protein
MMFLFGCCVMDSKSSTASVNSGSDRKLTQLIVEDDRKWWYRIKKGKQLSLIMTFCGIVSKQFKKYLTLHVDNSKQKNMADMWFPGLGKSETHCSCL